MFIDITLEVTDKMTKDASINEKKSLSGHLGTHFDVMNKKFPVEFFKRKGIIFDIRNIRGRDIEIYDIEMEKVDEDCFVIFYSGFIEEETYGSEAYYSKHLELSMDLIYELLKRKVSMIGIDFSGVRRGAEHTITDQICADAGTFIVENLCNLEEIPKDKEFNVYTFPIKYSNMTGLPCRVAVEVMD